MTQLRRDNGRPNSAARCLVTDADPTKFVSPVATAAAQPPVVQPNTAAFDPQAATLGVFLAANKFAAFRAALEELGVADANELADVSDEQLSQVGFNAIQLKSVFFMRRQAPAAAAAADQSVGASTK